MFKNKDIMEPHMFELKPTSDYDPILDIMKMSLSVQMHTCRDKCRIKGKCIFTKDTLKLNPKT